MSPRICCAYWKGLAVDRGNAHSPENALRQILRLIDLGCDLERNMSDGEFAREERHEIIPVLDENLFEMFVTPHRFLEASETFYADLWGLSRHGRELGRNYETQAAVLTAEYLLTRQHPGATDKTIYMTEFHRWELADRLDRLQQTLELQRERDPKTYDEELDRKFAILGDLVAPGSKRGRSHKSDDADPFLNVDLAKLSREANRFSEGLDEDALNRIAAARKTAAVLASSRIAEPLDQLVRVGSPEILDRVTMLQNRFRPVGKELLEIDKDADQWFNYIVDELRTPGHRGRYRAKDDVGFGKATWNDARTIAYLRWVIRQKLLPHQSLVFITGDLLLFDTYRRWYFERRGKDAPSEPFFFRRVAQYTPLFNPADSGGDLLSGGHNRKSELFSLMRQVIDATLIALPEEKTPDPKEKSPPPPPQPPANTPEGITDPRLESLALKQVSLEPEQLADDPDLLPIVDEMRSKGWTQHAGTIIQDNRELWQEMERLSIGASFDLVYDRMSEEQRTVASRYAAAGRDETSLILTEYASTVLNRLLQNNFRIWLPLAQTLLDSGIDDPIWRYPRIQRISVALRMPVSVEWEGLSSVASRPEIVFTRAALKALELQDVSNVARFAGHALRAMQLRDTVRSSVDSFEFELKYLNAVAQRLSIATVQAHLRSGGTTALISERSGFRAIEQFKTMYGLASVHLHQCLAAHYLLADEDPDQAVRYLRVLSERASLHLFIATSFGLATGAHRDQLRSDAVHYLELARDDLKHCLEFDSKTPVDDPLMDVVRSQFIPNVAGYEVLSYLMSADRAYKMEPWSTAVRKKVMAFWEREQRAHPLLSAELYSFALLADMTPPAGKRVTKAGFQENLSKLRLPLDRHLYRDIFRQLLNDYL